MKSAEKAARQTTCRDQECQNSAPTKYPLTAKKDERVDHRLFLCEVISYKNINEGKALTLDILREKKLLDSSKLVFRILPIMVLSIITP